MRWLTDSDQLAYAKKKDVKKSDYLATKREVTQVTASLFDPLGYLSPVQVKAKTFIQDIWKRNLDLDEPLETDLANRWKHIVSDFNASTEIKIDRRYFAENTSADHELHVFADASCKAYGAAAYLRRGDKTSLVMAKTRVAPIKELSLPCLELMAALVGSRLLRFVQDALQDKVNITDRTLWSDNQCVIHWITRRDKKLPVFVANRVKEIRNVPCTIKYCPTKDNPADLLTRGISTRELEKSNLWWQGPPWLKQGDWPICPVFDSSTYHVSTEEDVGTLSEDYNKPSDDRSKPSVNGIQLIIDVNRYSGLTKLLRVTALVLRFISNLKQKASRKTGLLTADELNRAEIEWIKDVQRQEFADIAKKIRDNKKKTLLSRQLGLFTDKDGILRCGGRLHNAPLDFVTKFPILLPPAHRFTDLVILNAHARALHSGLQTTVTYIRRRFWIAKIRQTVKNC
ncbi:uncharacterized protein [Ptychodera flava]|uniref:uncharacterized protein n=1 Tax=Ptychodera flava TaxID=63121 RepID=UPI003969D0A5